MKLVKMINIFNCIKFKASIQLTSKLKAGENPRKHDKGFISQVCKSLFKHIISSFRLQKTNSQFSQIHR